MQPIGLLALQGDFEAHRRILAGIDVPSRLARGPKDLDSISGLILPGGETTTQIKLAREAGLLEAIERFRDSGRPIFGTCAGAILLARKVSKPAQFSLGLIDIDIERNAYGRQRESFEAMGTIEPTGPGGASGLGEGPLGLVFLRAPRITRWGGDITVLVRHGRDPVLVRQHNVMAATFHPEIEGEPRVHRYFARIAAGVETHG